MASEYFSTLQYIWLNVVFFVFSLFLFAVCLYACLFVRWVYKRRLRQKTDEMIEAYKGEENKRKEIELNLKKQELEYPEKKKKRKGRDIHIVTKPCNHIIQKNSRELIVRQINEAPNDEVSCEPTGQPPQPIQQQYPQIINPNQIQTMDQFEQQYVLVPVEVLGKPGKVRHVRETELVEKLVVESVATQTSDRSEEETPKVEKKTSEDWLSTCESKEGEKIDVDEEYDEQESEKFMRRRREAEEKKQKAMKKPKRRPDVASDEVRVSIESDMQPPPTTSNSDVTSSDSRTSDPSKGAKTTSELGVTSSDPSKDTRGSSDPSQASSDAPKESEPKKSPPKDGSGPDQKDKPTGDKSYVASQYYGQPGENTSGLSSNNSAQPPKSSPAAATRPSIFPYWVDPKAQEPSVSTSKASSKLTEPDADNLDSSCALYRSKKRNMANDSAKVYMGTPKSKTPK